jgi:Protein of unknown function (DUF3106)
VNHGPTPSPRPVRLVAALVLALGLGLGPAVFAQVGPAGLATADTGGPAWATLTPAQQSALAPLKRDWSGIDATRKQKWLEIAARFPAMPADERQRVQDRMAEWARMTPDERGRARLQFQEARQISPQDRQARWDAYLALPVEERKALAKSASVVPPAARPGAASSRLAVSQNQKINVVNAPSPQRAPKSISPTVVQAKPGASTTLITQPATPPAHAQVGQPKIAASQDVVNRSTMLPHAGPQSVMPAPLVTPPAAASASSR